MSLALWPEKTDHRAGDIFITHYISATYHYTASFMAYSHVKDLDAV